LAFGTLSVVLGVARPEIVAGRVSIGGNLLIAGTCTGTTCSSDIRLKKNIESLRGSLDDLARLRPVSFEWKDPQGRGMASGRQVGFIAQEVEKVKPEWVGVDDQGFRTLDTTKFQVLLVDSVRTLKEQNDALRERVKLLEDGRRPMISGVGEGGIGLGLLAIAGAVVVGRRKRSELAG
jgi:Chaperone of endosialidase